MKDFQKNRVYKWEDAVVSSRCPRQIAFKDAQCFVDGIFLCEGLVGSPLVSPMPKQARKVLATGCRAEIRLPEVTPAWVIIHELAHTLTDDMHGPNFMGVYLKLLDKYLNLPLPLSMFSLQDKKIQYNLAARPCFVDQ